MKSTEQKLEEMKRINIQKDEVEMLMERVMELKDRPSQITHIDIQGYKFVVPDTCVDSLFGLLTAFQNYYATKRKLLITEAEVIINEN